MTGQIILISGSRGAGKTTLCQQVIELARSQGWNVSGILTLGDYVDGEKVSLYAQDVRTGERRLLARRSYGGRYRWDFVEETLAWGNSVFASAIPTDLLVVDELGPLEWLDGRGWTAGLHAIDSREYRYALVVTRPELVERARARWPGFSWTMHLRRPSAGEGV